MADNGERQRDVRYEANDRPQHALAAALGAQSVALILAGIVLTPVIVLRAGGVETEFAPWAIFVALIVSGLTTLLQARPVWRSGAGYVLFMGTSGAFISVCVTAILDGGIAMMTTLIVASSLIQFPLAANLGLYLAMRDGIDYEKILIVGLSFWLGIGFQNKALFYDLMPGWPQTLMSNGVTAGTMVAVLLTLLFRARRSRPHRLSTELSASSVPAVHEFVAALGQRIGWEAGSINRLQLTAEEAIVVMLDKSDAAAPVRQLRLEAREEEGAIELDVVVAPRGANLEDALPLAMLGTAPPEDVLPFRILASIVDDFRHQQFHGIDFVTLRVRGRTC